MAWSSELRAKPTRVKRLHKVTTGNHYHYKTTLAPAPRPSPCRIARAMRAPPAQRPTQPQPTPRPEPPAGSKLVWVLVVAILALVVRKMLKGGCADDEENLLDDALCKT